MRGPIEGLKAHKVAFFGSTRNLIGPNGGLMGACRGIKGHIGA